MTEPTDAPAEQALADFLAVWDTCTDDDGLTMPLPGGWRTKVMVLAEAGVSTADWEYALDSTITQMGRDWHPVKPTAAFNYATAIVWNQLDARSPWDSRARGEYVADPEAAERSRRQRAAAQERRERRERGEAERRQREREQRAFHRDQIEREAIKAPCPYCHVEAAKPCLLPDGSPRLHPNGRPDLHAARETLVRRAVDANLTWSYVLGCHCPTCGATEGGPCVLTSGTGERAGNLHADRVGVARSQAVAQVAALIGKVGCPAPECGVAAGERCHLPPGEDPEVRAHSARWEAAQEPDQEPQRATLHVVGDDR